MLVRCAASSIVRLLEQQRIGAGTALRPFQTYPGAGIALRVEVDDQHLAADGSQRRCQVDRRRRLTDAAFLVRDRNDSRLRRGVAD